MATLLRRTLVLSAFLLGTLPMAARSLETRLLVFRVYRYAADMDTLRDEPAPPTYTYQRYHMRTLRRNPVLMAVPSMYAVAHGGAREYVGEAYDRVEMTSRYDFRSTRLLERTTIPHGRRTMPTLLRYLTPRLYSERLVDGDILSPFNRRNRKCYRYCLDSVRRDTAYLSFSPRLRNTMLVSGWAKVSINRGCIYEATIDGEYDMIRFHIVARMGRTGLASLLPERCRLESRFRFLGNDIAMDYEARYGLTVAPMDSIADRADTLELSRVRPWPLSEEEQEVFRRRFPPSQADSLQPDSTQKKHPRLAQLLWDNVGERLLGRIKSNFGSRDQGYFRINPILNPLYLGYSQRRGLTYKFDVRGNYYFTDNSLIEARLKAGYAFRQHQFYFNIPITYHFDRRREGFLRLEVGNGNRITNGAVAEAVKQQSRDSIDWDRMGLSYFRDMTTRLTLNYRLTDWLDAELALVTHRRSAIDRTGFELAGRPTRYISTAPMIELRFRPWGATGPVLSADYERGIKGLLRSNIAYERIELDAQWKRSLRRLSALQLRLGTGFYTSRGKESYFLDYTNFHDNRIPGGWNDDWANNFELLDANWYNASPYYVRANVTYESPFIALSWLPLVGRFVEKERIYINTLSVRRLHPYVEYGYGFTTRLFSIGAFVAQQNGHFDGVGCKFGFELFREW